MRRRWFQFLLLLVIAAGCEREDMHNQPRFEPLEASDFFADGQSARPRIAGTVARGEARVLAARPPGLTRPLLERGRQRYDIFCAVCHGATGDGGGMVVRRGFTRPPSFHIQRLREAPDQHFVDVISNGYGAMYSYADRISIDDRWAITTYVRALQLSQRADLVSLPPEDRQKAQEVGR